MKIVNRHGSNFPSKKYLHDFSRDNYDHRFNEQGFVGEWQYECYMRGRNNTRPVFTVSFNSARTSLNKVVKDYTGHIQMNSTQFELHDLPLLTAALNDARALLEVRLADDGKQLRDLDRALLEEYERERTEMEAARKALLESTEPVGDVRAKAIIAENVKMVRNGYDFVDVYFRDRVSGNEDSFKIALNADRIAFTNDSYTVSRKHATEYLADSNAECVRVCVEGREVDG